MFYHYLWWRDNQAAMNSRRPHSARRQVRNIEGYLDSLTDSDVVDLYRLDKHGINHFTERISNHQDIARNTSAGLSAAIQLIVALRYYATGNSIMSLKNTAELKLSHGAVYNSIKNVSNALCSLLREDVSYNLENNNRTSEIMEGFYRYGGFPCCLGAVDGTMIKIKAPPVREDVYVGRKEGHYLNVQFVCDSELTFLDAVIKFPGSVPDKTIWDLCSLKEKMDKFIESQGSGYRGWLIGDSGYMQREHMMIPIEDPKGKHQAAYQKAHIKTRNTIERAIGVYKSRFRCMCKQSGGSIQFDVDMCCKIIGACAVLHNYCRKRNIPFEVAPDVRASVLEEQNTGHEVENETDNPKVKDEVIAGYMARQNVVDAYFSH